VSLPTVELPSGERIPALGLGTWKMGETRTRRAEEIAALRLGLDLGMTLIDTAEMYGDGATEELVAEAIAGRRDEVFLVSKVYPHNASQRGVVEACERSLRRLGTDRIDLYLLHWRGAVPLSQTIAGFAALRRAGKIRHWGVSNLDHADMPELWQLDGGQACATNQVLYNLSRRGVEWDLLPWCRERKLPIMAYSPLEQTRLFGDRTLGAVAKRHGATPAQVALAWLLQQEGVIVIPKAGKAPHVRENRAALDLRLDDEDRAALDRAFPPPQRAAPLAML
jgi:diketogulonate reductase-like aldo/keto reductase